MSKSKPNSINLKSNAIMPVIVFGTTETGKPRAGVFRGADVEPALKAAQLLKFSVAKTDNPQVRELCSKLPIGRIAAKGEHSAVRSKRTVRTLDGYCGAFGRLGEQRQLR